MIEFNKAMPYEWPFQYHRIHNILDDDVFGQLYEAASEGRILAITGGPNCRTWSKLLSRPQPGQFHGPLRGPDGPALWGLPATWDSPELTTKCENDSLLLLRQVLLILVANLHGVFYFLEHPADPGRPHPSWWRTDQASALETLTHGMRLCFDACRLGHWTRKETAAITNLQELAQR